LIELDTEVLLGIQRSGHGDERLSEVGIDAPVSDLIGVG